tara:strand:+ start:103 stop:384 length:282 start_codon:yes stop_codon:yes gene_type:complete
MRILLVLSIFILTIFIIGKKILFSARTNLFKDQAAWSGKDITIKYSDSKGIKKSKEINNYLKRIADESKVYLDDQSLDDEKSNLNKQDGTRLT